MADKLAPLVPKEPAAQLSPGAQGGEPVCRAALGVSEAAAVLAVRSAGDATAGDNLHGKHWQADSVSIRNCGPESDFGRALTSSELSANGPEGKVAGDS